MEDNSTFRVGLVQMSCGPDPDANLEKAVERVREAARQGAAVVCLPELFRAQYFCQREDIRLFDLAETIPGPSTEKLGAVAREEKVVVIASLFERRAPGLYHNTAAILEKDGRIAGLYRKMHIPDDPLYYEKFYFTPGDLGFRAFDTSAGKIGTLVCWDQWYPEGARITALQGANILFYPTAIGWHPSEKEESGTAQYDAWQIDPARARHCQRRLRGGCQSRWYRAWRCARQSRRRAWFGVLGRIIPRRSIWARDRQSQP